MDMVLFTHQEIQMVLSEWEMVNLLWTERHLGARVRAGTGAEAAGAAFLRGERAATPRTGLRP